MIPYPPGVHLLRAELLSVSPAETSTAWTHDRSLLTDHRTDRSPPPHSAPPAQLNLDVLLHAEGRCSSSSISTTSIAHCSRSAPSAAPSAGRPFIKDSDPQS
ncbi:hypothetical protein AOLI_G00329800 [Acnodon oligacanthus]